MAVNIVASNALDGNLAKAEDQKATASTKNRVDNQPVAPFDDGEYIVLQQKHFNVKVTRPNGEPAVSSRLVVVNLDKKYARSYKISDLNATVASVEFPDQDTHPLIVETRKDPRDNSTEVKRLKSQQLPRPVRALTAGYLPIVTEGDDIVVVSPFKMTIRGNLTGHNVSYVEQEGNAGHYDVELDENEHVVFNQVSYPAFSTDQTVTDSQIKAAKAIIAADAQMKNLTNGRLS